MDKIMNDKEKLIQYLITQTDKVFFYCIKRCNSRIDAEDLSQDILLDIMISINKGIKIENFDYYIWQICKNHYSKYVARIIKDREKVMFVEEIDEPGNELSSLDRLINSEKISMINAAIKLLSSDYAEILYSYYIEDRSLSFIAEKLNLPLGTVKRRLFDIRNKLKEYLKMERINGKKAYVPKEFDGHMNGGSYDVDPFDYVSTLINQNLLFHSYGNPCSLEDYSIEMGISLPYIKNIVEKLERATLLMKNDEGKYLTNFIIIDKKTDEKILNLIREKSSSYTSLLADYCKEHFEQWKKLVNNPLLDDNKLMWTYLFNVNRKVEQLDQTIAETMKNSRPYGHQFSDGGWDFSMTEKYESNKNSFYINECINGNGVLGIQGLFYPGQRDIKNIDSEALKCLMWDNSANWDADFELFGYLLKNKNIKYSDCVYTLKTSVDKMVERNYLKIIDNEIKFNFVLFNFENSKLNKEDDYDIGLNNVKIKRKEITKEIEEVVKNVIPEYLYKDLNYISSSYFLAHMRQYVVKKFEELGLIKAINTERFVWNMFCWERK